MKNLEKEVAKAWERKTRKLLESYKKTAAKTLAEKIDPDRWYGTCYGRDLDREHGKHYQ